MASKAASNAQEIPEEDRQRMRFRKALARKKRKDRETAGEIKELNIIAMMDIMTIILVFLLKSFATSSVAMTSSEEVRPPVSSARATPKDTVAITITPRHVLVGDKVKAVLEGGKVRPADLQGRLVIPLDAALKKEVEKLKYIAARNPAAPFTHELTVIGDKRVQYDLLMTVLYTAGQNELENYRFIVIQKDQ